MRLDKYLADMGVGSRSEVKKLIKQKLVLVNGEVAKDGKVQVAEGKDSVQLAGEEIGYQKFVYLMLNKPTGVISATEDNFQKTVLDLLDDSYAHFELFPVGRLDKDTVGLLLLTNDGQLAHRLLSPKHHVDKIYYAKVEGQLEEEHIALFKEGLVLKDGTKCLPADLEILQSGEKSEIRLTIQEGKFHQVKRMVEVVGGKVTYLKRLSMGAIHLDKNLAEGDYRPLTNQEVDALMEY